MPLRKILPFLLILIALSTLTGCEILPHRHRYLGVTKLAASCENTGLKEYECEFCEGTYTEILPVLWHTAGSDSNCIRCGREVAKNLNFFLNEYGDGYIVNDSENHPYFNTELIIPAYYEALPVVAIAEGAFMGGVYDKIKIAPTIKTIGASAFKNATNFTEVYIFSENLIIGASSFENCITLSTIHLRNTIAEIKENAFNNCISLSKIHFYGTPEQFSSIIIKSGNDPFINANIEYHLP